MARDVSNFRTVINQVAERQDEVVNSLANIGKSIIATSQEAKIAENFSKVQLELNQLNAQYQVDFEGDPFGGVSELQESRQDIFDKHGGEISPLFKRNWNSSVKDLALKDDAATEMWGFKQTRVNTVKSINTSIDNNMRQASIDGQNFGNLDTEELDTVINYGESKSKLIEFGDKHLGENTTTEMLENYDEDYLKSFLSGAIDTNPEKALRLLEDDKVKNSMDLKDLNTLKKSAKSRILNFNKTRNERAILDVMTGENGLYQLSLERDLSTAELESAYRKNNTPKTVQNVLNKMNGYGSTKDKLTNAQKVSNKNEFFDLLASMEVAENISAKDIDVMKNKIYNLLDNESLTKEQGGAALNQLVAPMIRSLEANLEQYSYDSFIPFDEIGFTEVKKIFKKDFKVSVANSFLSKNELKKTNELNQLRLYENYQAALVNNMPQGIPVGDIGSLSKKERNRIFEQSQKDALSEFAFQSSGLIVPEDATKQDITNAIQGVEEQKLKTEAQDIVDKAYRTPPKAQAELRSFNSVEQLNAANLTVGTIVIVNGVRGTVTE